MWVEKEYRNLCRVHSAGVPSPQPLYVRHNLLLMTLIGEPDLPAPQLRNVALNTTHWQCAFDQTMQVRVLMDTDFLGSKRPFSFRRYLVCHLILFRACEGFGA